LRVNCFLRSKIEFDKDKRKFYHSKEGGVAQVVRANGSYPLCPGFKSLHRHHPSLRKFREWVKNLALESGDRILLAYSGGGDSAGMLSLFQSIEKKFNFEIGLCHINHSLRGEESLRDEEVSRKVAKDFDLPFFSYRLESKPEKGRSIEEWSREGRYFFLEKCRKKEGYDFIATAHTMDDQAETLLLRIARGCGIEGLKGIEIKAGNIIRPCLSIRSKELKEVAKECNIRYVEDSSNKSKRFLRNRLRLKIMPLLEKEFPSIVANLFSLSLIVQSSEVSIPSVAKLEGNSLYYPLRVFSSMSLSDATFSFRMGLKMLKGDLKGLNKRHFEGIAKLITSNKGAFVPLPGNIAAFREEDGIRLKRKKIGAVR
jgi:tRNA(Ile)-lysidine synthase